MSSPQVVLGDILAPAIDEVTLSPNQSYRIAGIYSFGKGIFERETILGADTSYPKLVRLHENQFVVSKLNGWEGAIDVVSSDVAGCHVSSEYPTFAIDTDRADPAYVRWITRWPSFWARLVPRGSMVRRKRVQPRQLLDVSIPLPSIEDQRRVAARLDRLHSAVQQVTLLADRNRHLSDAFVAACASRPDISDIEKRRLGWVLTDLRQVMGQAKDPVPVDPAESYPNLGLFSFGRGLFSKQPIEGAQTSAKTLYRVKSGQFIYSRLFAFEGAYGVVPDALDGFFVSNEFPSFDADPERMDARWLASYLRSRDRWAELAATSVGLGVTRQRVPVEAVLAYKVWLPLIEQQRRMLREIEQLSGAQRARSSIDERVDSLVPAAMNLEFGLTA